MIASQTKEKSRLLLVTGGGGKSTLIDELVQRFLTAHTQLRVAILANDPATGSPDQCSALLADRVRMNAIYHPRVFLHSLSSGALYRSWAPELPQLSRLLLQLGFNLVIVETPGSGQSGLDLSPFKADLKLFIKTSEYGDNLQLQKEQLLQDADLVVLNKIDQHGSETAYLELQAQMQHRSPPAALIAVMAKSPQDPGLEQLFQEIEFRCGWSRQPAPVAQDVFTRAKQFALVPHSRRNYLADVVAKVQAYDHWVDEQLHQVRQDPANLAALAPSASNC